MSKHEPSATVRLEAQIGISSGASEKRGREMNDKVVVLAVDDTAESLALLHGILTPAGYDVRTAECGELALAAVAADRPDLVLLDMRMKGMDGLQVCQRLQAREETRKIPIILISAFAEVNDWVEGLRLGAVDFITKPFQVEELLTRVRTHLALRKAAASLEQMTAELRRTNEHLQSEIVERRRVEDELRQSLERGELAQRAAGMGHFSWDIETNLTTRSDGMSALYGLPPDNHNDRYHKWRERVFPDDLPALDAATLESLTSGELSHDFRVVRPDASLRWLHARGKVSFSDEGKPLRMVGVNFDITDRMKASEALRASEEQYRTLFEAIDTGFCVIEMLLDPGGKAADYRFLEVNPAFERQTGLQEAVGKTMRQMVPNHEAYWFDIYGEVSRTGQAIRFENAAAALNRYYDVFAFRIGGEGSRKVGILFNDIAERKRTECALRESETALAVAQEIAQVGSWILYPESGEVRASPVMFRMFALDPGPVALLPLFINRIHEDDRSGVEAGLAAAAQTGTADFEFRIVTPDGTRAARAMVRKREVGESHPSLIGTTRDITEQKAAEEAIRQQRDRLARSNADLERFNRLAVGRELRMIELKQQINDLCAQLGKPPSYVLPEEHAIAEDSS